MSIYRSILSSLGWPDYEQKSQNINQVSLKKASAESIRNQIAAGFDPSVPYLVSAVHACARVIAEGLALPPCYVHYVSAKGKKLANDHPLYDLLNKSPNERQTSYEFREWIGWNLALFGNAYIYIERDDRGTVLKLLPIDHGMVTTQGGQNGRLFDPIVYSINGQTIDADKIWHIKGPSWRTDMGMSLSDSARQAIALAAASESFGANLFRNGAKPGGLLTPAQPMTVEQLEQFKSLWDAQAAGVDNAHKLLFLPTGFEYKQMSSTADEAQWTESRKFQIEEICRFFRVSPTKIFLQNGSQSYASVEQAHISHDQDTDAHWQARFVQSSNKALLSAADKRAGVEITIDNRDALRGTARDRVAYYKDAIASGIMTQNEARELEGFDRFDDPEADRLKPAANLFGKTENPPTE